MKKSSSYGGMVIEYNNTLMGSDSIGVLESIYTRIARSLPAPWSRLSRI